MTGPKSPTPTIHACLMPKIRDELLGEILEARLMLRDKPDVKKEDIWHNIWASSVKRREFVRLDILLKSLYSMIDKMPDCIPKD